MEKTSNDKRRHLMVAAGVGAVAVGAAIVLRTSGWRLSYPHGVPMAVELGDLPQGKLRAVEWQGKPVWVLRRSVADVAALAIHEEALADPHSQESVQPPYCRNRYRSLRPEFFVAIGLCTHQGCTPALLSSGGFLCPCHGSRFDLAGRVFRLGPASANLVIPAYRFETESRLLVGMDA